MKLGDSQLPRLAGVHSSTDADGDPNGIFARYGDRPAAVLEFEVCPDTDLRVELYCGQIVVHLSHIIVGIRGA